MRFISSRTALIKTLALVLLGVSMFTAVVLADGGEKSTTASELDELLKYIGTALGAIAITVAAFKSHIGNSSIHRTTEQNDKLYLRKEEAKGELGDYFVPRNECILTSRYVCETLTGLKEAMDKLTDKVDSLHEKIK